MGQTTQVDALRTPQAYLAGELTAAVRSEHVGGRVSPMPGVGVLHERRAATWTMRW